MGFFRASKPVRGVTGESEEGGERVARAFTIAPLDGWEPISRREKPWWRSRRTAEDLFVTAMRVEHRPWNAHGGMMEPFANFAVVFSSEADAWSTDAQAGEDRWRNHLASTWGGNALDEEGREWPAARRAGEMRCIFLDGGERFGDHKYALACGYGLFAPSEAVSQHIGEVIVTPYVKGVLDTRSAHSPRLPAAGRSVDDQPPVGIYRWQKALMIGHESTDSPATSNAFPTDAKIYVEWTRKRFNVGGAPWRTTSTRIVDDAFEFDVLDGRNGRPRAQVRVTLDARPGRLQARAPAGPRLRLDGILLETGSQANWRLELDEDGAPPMHGGAFGNVLLRANGRSLSMVDGGVEKRISGTQTIGARQAISVAPATDTLRERAENFDDYMLLRCEGDFGYCSLNNHDDRLWRASDSGSGPWWFNDCYDGADDSGTPFSALAMNGAEISFKPEHDRLLASVDAGEPMIGRVGDVGLEGGGVGRAGAADIEVEAGGRILIGRFLFTYLGGV